jgi:hypothetical protein
MKKVIQFNTSHDSFIGFLKKFLEEKQVSNLTQDYYNNEGAVS